MTTTATTATTATKRTATKRAATTAGATASAGPRFVPRRTKSYRDNIQTPDGMAREIVSHFAPSGHVLEPCAGDGSFVRALADIPAVSRLSWREVRPALASDFDLASEEPGRAALREGAVYGGTGSFFDWQERVDWIVTNPPYGNLTSFLDHAMRVADHVVFLILLSAPVFTARLRLAHRHGFGLRELHVCKAPSEWSAQKLTFGVPLAAVHWERGYTGDTRGLNASLLPLLGRGRAPKLPKDTGRPLACA